MKEASITYLYHSGFAVETPNHFLIFDYYNNTTAAGENTLSNGVINSKLLPSDKTIYVFVTHSHGDHYNPVIFQWSKTHEINYILSNDISINATEENKISLMGPYENFKTDEIEIKTFGTTDKGVSFLIAVDGLNIFHSGDLNWWHWKEFTKDQQLQEELDFKRELDKLIGEEIDIAFLPVDPRLEEFAFLAGEYFISKLKPKLFIPMHFADSPEISKEFALRIEDFPTSAVVITGRGQQIIFSK